MQKFIFSIMYYTEKGKCWSFDADTNARTQSNDAILRKISFARNSSQINLAIDLNIFNLNGIVWRNEMKYLL